MARCRSSAWARWNRARARTPTRKGPGEGVSGLGTNGELRCVSVAALEPCASANIDQNGAVRRGLTSHDLVSNVQVAGVSNLNLTIINDSLAGAILKGSGTLNGASWTGTVILLK